MIKNIDEIAEEDIKILVDSVIHARGKEYYEEGLVQSLETEGNKIIAEVKGNSIYDVEISLKEGRLQGICSCPYDGETCKHTIAVLYQWIHRNDAKNTENNVLIKKAPAFESYLEKFSKKELISILSELSRAHKEVKHDLSLRMAASSKEPNEGNIATILNHFNRELRENNLDYYQLPYVLRSLERIKESIKHASPAVRQRLLDYFVDKTTKAYEDGADDSSGNLGEFISECIEELGKAIVEQNLSFEKKKEVLKKYLEAMINDEYSFDENYAELILNVAEQPSDYDFLIAEIKVMIEKTKDKYCRDGLREFLIEVYKKSRREKEYLREIENNLEYGEDYMRLADFWKEKRDVKRAIEIAQNGIDKRKNSWGNDELFRFLEELYQKEDDEKKLLEIYVLHFSEASSLQFYRKIKALAQKLDHWDSLRSTLPKEAEDHVYVDILLEEGEEEKAIREALTNIELPDKSLEKVARFIKKERPKKAIHIYDGLVKKYIKYGARGAYAVAAEHARSIKDIYMNIKKDTNGWAKYIGGVRKEHYKKSALIDELRKL